MTNLHLLKPTVANSDSMQGPAQIDDVANFAEQGWHFRQGTGAERGALTSSELHAGLIWKDTDGLRGLYGRNTANNGWDTLNLPGIKRSFLFDPPKQQVLASVGVSNHVLQHIDFGTVAVARRVALDVAGTVGFAAGGGGGAGVYVDPTGCTLTSQSDNFDETIETTNAGKWYGYSLRRFIDIAAGAAASVDLMAIALNTNQYYRLTIRGDVLLAGEY